MPHTEQQAKVCVSSEDQPERVIELQDCLTIGRSSGNHLVVAHQRASRKHAEIRRVSHGVYKVFDVGSRNGTWVNGQRISGSRELQDGDQIVVGGTTLRFISAVKVHGELTDRTQSTRTMPTMMALRHETVLVLVSDIRNYTGMSEKLPREELQTLLSEWFRENIRIVEGHRGVVDKFIGDAVMAYWVVGDPDDPSPEVNETLRAAREMVALSTRFSEKIQGRFGYADFKIGIGINMGEASIGNVGTGAHQSFTVVGDSVNVAFRLESLTKEKNKQIVVNREVAQWASTTLAFEDLGETQVKGRGEPISILALKL